VKRCCLCRALHGLIETSLPGSGWRCRDEVNCKRRVKAIQLSAKWPADEVPSRP
jgi:hypothetical protein